MIYKSPKPKIAVKFDIDQNEAIQNKGKTT